MPSDAGSIESPSIGGFLPAFPFAAAILGGGTAGSDFFEDRSGVGLGLRGSHLDPGCDIIPSKPDCTSAATCLQYEDGASDGTE